MPSVKYAISAYTADGTTTDYLITWDYLDEDHIAVYVDGTSNADPTASHTFVQLNSTTLRITDNLGNAIVSGAEIEIRRETPLTNRAITFADGSALLAEDLNKNSDYLLYSMQEVLDTVEAAAQDGALAAQVATEAFRDEAEVFKDDAEAAKNTTQGYLATVQSDATDADNHRIAAAASEAAAATSEANAAVSETNSANSATASAASAAASLASEQAAAASETASAASEVAAAASQVASATSEANAATSEANAEAAWDSFDDRYLGAKASAPTVDNDGNALLTGALYWNSTSDEMYVWNGASWDTFNSTIGIADGASSTAVTIDANGNVGIGTNVPTSKITLGGETIQYATALLVQETGHATSERAGIQTGGWIFGQDQAGAGAKDFFIYDGNTSQQRVLIDSSGRVGIGNAAPTESLAVRTYGNSEISTQYGTGIKARLGAYSNGARVSVPTGSVDFDLASEVGAIDTVNLRAYYNGTWKWGLKMDPEGRISQPNKPICVVSTQTGWSTLLANTAYGLTNGTFHYNQGGFYAGGGIGGGSQVVHVPLTGWYKVHLSVYQGGNQPNRRLMVRANSNPLAEACFVNSHDGGTDYTHSTSGVIYLNANDYLHYYNLWTTYYTYHAHNHTYVIIEFIG